LNTKLATNPEVPIDPLQPFTFSLPLRTLDFSAFHKVIHDHIVNITLEEQTPPFSLYYVGEKGHLCYLSGDAHLKDALKESVNGELFVVFQIGVENNKPVDQDDEDEEYEKVELSPEPIHSKIDLKRQGGNIQTSGRVSHV
jgi:hypothetical protein